MEWNELRICLQYQRKLRLRREDVPSDSRGWAVAAHLLPFVSLAIIGPLFVWLIKRDEDEFVEDQAREALNFQLSL